MNTSINSTVTASRLRPRGKNAFSAIEVLVTFVVVGLLLAIAYPSLDEARSRTRQSVCLDKLHRIGLANNTYTTEDPNGMSVPIHEAQYKQDPNNPSFIGAYEWGGKSGVGRPGWTGPAKGEHPELTSRFGTAAGFGPAERPLNPYLYPHGFRNNRLPEPNVDGAIVDTRMPMDVYQCPGDDGPPFGDEDGNGPHCSDWINSHDRSAYDHFGTSYSANVLSGSFVGGSNIFSVSPYLRPAVRVPDPDKTVLYEETIGRWAWATRRTRPECSFTGLGVDPGPTRSIRGWHGKDWTFNHAFVDGHVGTKTPRYEETVNEIDGYPLHYFNPDPFAEPGLFESFRCLIVRNADWQLDTFPDSPIPMTIFWPGGGRSSFVDCVKNMEDESEPLPPAPSGTYRYGPVVAAG